MTIHTYTHVVYYWIFSIVLGVSERKLIQGFKINDAREYDKSDGYIAYSSVFSKAENFIGKMKFIEVFKTLKFMLVNHIMQMGPSYIFRKYFFSSNKLNIKD